MIRYFFAVWYVAKFGVWSYDINDWKIFLFKWLIRVDIDTKIQPCQLDKKKSQIPSAILKIIFRCFIEEKKNSKYTLNTYSVSNRLSKNVFIYVFIRRCKLTPINIFLIYGPDKQTHRCALLHMDTHTNWHS